MILFLLVVVPVVTITALAILMKLEANDGEDTL